MHDTFTFFRNSGASHEEKGRKRQRCNFMAGSASLDKNKGDQRSDIEGQPVITKSFRYRT